MEYIVHRRFKGKCISGTVNLPYGTKCAVNGNIITANGRAIAATTSENAYQYFARNDDGQGLKRGELTQEIRHRLNPDYKHTKKERKMPLQYWQPSEKQSKQYEAAKEKANKAWERIWDDPKLLKFKRKEFADHWLWNYEFYNAEICDLEYILNLIKEN